MTPEIRPATQADLDRLLTMVHALAAHHGDPPACTREALERDVFGPEAFLRVLIADGGYTALYPMASLHWGVRGMEMHHLFVEEAQRGTGLGGALVQAAVALTKAEGGRFLTLGTHPGNAAARDFYVSLGFQPHHPGHRWRLRF
jgi:Acetyltransferases